MTTDNIGTTEQAAALCGVKPGTYRSYVARFGAPKRLPRSEPGRSGQDLYDLTAVAAWHASRQGRGRRRNPIDPAPIPTPVVNLPVVVYCRGAGASPHTWSRITWAIADAGWYQVDDYTTAWHLARGGTTTVMLDFTPAYGSGYSKGTILVQRVRARYDDEQEPELVRTKGRSGGVYPRPKRVDPDVLDRMGQPGAIALDIEAVINLIHGVLPTGHLGAAEEDQPLSSADVESTL